MPKTIPTRPVAVLLVLLALARARARDALFPPVGPADVPAPADTAGRPQPATPPEFDLYAPEQGAGGPRKVQSVTAGDWGSLTASSTLHDVDGAAVSEDPLNQRAWQTNESWRCPVGGPLFMYGQLGGGGMQTEQQDTKVSGKTGLGCKWAPVQDAEFTVRSGPSVSYTDPLRLDRVQEHSEWLLEVQARWPLLGKIGLEYQATAAPAMTPLDHDWMSHDLGLAMPVCPGGTIHLGARHKWENTTDPKTSPDSSELYFGLELTH